MAVGVRVLLSSFPRRRESINFAIARLSLYWAIVLRMDSRLRGNDDSFSIPGKSGRICR